MGIRNDVVLKTLICEVTAHRMPIKSLILVGSRARGVAYAEADYDVIAVMDTPLVLIYAPKLERLSSRLSTKFGIKIGIKPMPIFKIKHAKGNLFIMKIKKEAVLLAGRNIIPTINVGSPSDIQPEWYFSFLASLMKDLIQVYEPGKRIDVIRVSSKIRRSLTELSNLSIPCISLIIKSRLQNFSSAHGIKEWLNLKNMLVDLFLVFSRTLLNVEGDIPDVVWKFLRAYKGANPLKNIESCIILTLLKKELPTLNWLFSRILVKDRLRAALILLLASVTENGIENHLLDHSYQILKPCFRIKYLPYQTEARWKVLKDTILSYWDYIHTVMALFD